jgi:hypothetical protein
MDLVGGILVTLNVYKLIGLLYTEISLLHNMFVSFHNTMKHCENLTPVFENIGLDYLTVDTHI